MAKYIVEVAEPKKGQKVSSGGLREKGKLAAQFKNPVPYENLEHTSAVMANTKKTVIVRKEQTKIRLIEAGKYLLSIAWQEFGEPVLRSELHKFGDTIIRKIEAPTVQYMSSNEYEVIDVEVEAIKDTSVGV